MNSEGLTFGDTAAHLADVLATSFPEMLVGVEWPDEHDPPPMWMFIRDDGTDQVSVATGFFTGAVIVKSRSRREHRAMTQRVKQIIFDLQFADDSPVASDESRAQPYRTHDGTYGSIGVVPLELIILGTPMNRSV